MASGNANRQSNSSAFVRVPLGDVDIRAELKQRPRRAVSVEHEHRAFVRLAAEMAANPRNVLQLLVEIAIDLCDAHTAAISLLDGNLVRWEAVAGVLASARGGTMPRDASPCGVCIDRDATQLMRLPDRCFPALQAEPRVVEALLIPFHANDEPIGTVWIVSHNDECKFDSECERIVKLLSKFASAGWQLMQKSDALGRANQRKDTFLAILGHEMRMPLGAIVSSAAVIRQRMGNDETVRVAVDIIARQSVMMSRLADDLLDVARIETGKLELDRRPVDLRVVVADGVELLRSQIERRGHALSVSLGANSLIFDADPVRLVQVVTNLIDNAAKYTPDGGTLSVTLRVDGAEGLIVVSDSGVGIPPGRAEQIFEPYVQLAESRQAARGGVGVGLALVKTVTELHGGTVTVESSGVNAGATFTVRLPLLSKSRSDRRRAPREDRLEPSHPGVTALTKLAGHDRLRDRHREPDITIM